MSLAGKALPWLAVAAGAFGTADRVRQRREGGEGRRDAINNAVRENLLNLGGIGPANIGDPAVQEATEKYRPPALPERPDYGDAPPSPLVARTAQRFAPGVPSAPPAVTPPVAEPAADPTPAPAAQMQAASQRTVTPLGAGREMFYQSTPQGTASGTRPAGTGRGGFVGASTDAEARRNQAARMQQDQMADYNVQRMQRGAEAERDARAERLGISRVMLDRLEGRPDSARNLEIQEAMSRDPGVQERLMTERGLDRRAELAARTNIETAGMAQLGQSQRKQAELEAAARAAQEGRFGAGWKSAVDVLTKSDINPSRFMDWTATQFPKVAGAAGYSPEEIAAMIDDPTPQNLVVMMSMFSQSQQEQGKSWWRNRRTPEEIGRGFGS